MQELRRQLAANPVGDYPIGLLISGPTGCGKTHLAAAIANELMQREVSVVFQSVPELLIRIRSTYGRESTETEAQLLDALVGAISWCWMTWALSE